MALVDIKIWSDTYGTEAVARNLHIQSAVEALLVVTPGEAEMLAALLTDAATSARMLADTVRLDSLRFGDMFTIPLLSEPARSMQSFREHLCTHACPKSILTVEMAVDINFDCL
jgi:hypothetical protein